MKKVFILACAVFLSSQLMAQTTAKTTEAAQAKAPELSKQQVDAMSIKAEAAVAAPAPDLAQKAPAALTDTKVDDKQKKEAIVELSKVAPVPPTSKATPVKE